VEDGSSAEKKQTLLWAGFSKLSWLQQSLLASANSPGYSKLSWLQGTLLWGRLQPAVMAAAIRQHRLRQAEA
jgi:hypothetical protein